MRQEIVDGEFTRLCDLSNIESEFISSSHSAAFISPLTFTTPEYQKIPLFEFAEKKKRCEECQDCMTNFIFLLSSMFSDYRRRICIKCIKKRPRLFHLFHLAKQGIMVYYEFGDLSLGTEDSS